MARAAQANRTRRSRLYTDDHDLGCFDECGGLDAGAQFEFPGGIRGDDGGDELTADGKLDLRKQAIEAHLHDGSQQLVAAADGGSEFFSPGSCGTLGSEKRLNFAFVDTIVAAGSFDSSQFAAVEPLLDGGVGDAEPFGGGARGVEFAHKADYRRKCSNG